jgi:peptidyl-prolyl cis-trans isomerase SurA
MVDGVMATVNDQVISQSDVRNRMRWMLLRFEKPPEDEEILLELQSQALESLIDERVQLGEFRKLVKDQDISGPEIDESVADVARQYRMTPEQFAQALGQAGIPMQHIRDMEQAKIAWTALIRGRYFKTVRVSEGRIDDMLERIRSSLDKPQYRLAEIFLYAPDQASRELAKTRAQGMAEAPAIAKAVGISCAVTDARFIGKTEDKKAKSSTTRRRSWGAAAAWIAPAIRHWVPSS